MRIGIDARMLHKAGIRRYATELIANLSKIDQENHYIVYVSSADITGGIGDLASNFTLFYLDTPLFSVREQAVLISRLRKDQLDVFHTTFDFGVPPWPLPNIVVTVHDVFFGPDTFFRSYRTRLMYRFFTTYSVRRANRIIVVSEFIKNKLFRYVPKARRKSDAIRVIPNGVSPEFFYSADTEESARIKKKYHIMGRYLLCVGSFASRIKNLTGILRAFGQLPEHIMRNYQLVIAGEVLDRVPEAFPLLKDLERNNRLLCLGRVPDEDLPPLYRGAEVFLYPSLHEGFGIPILEAMACGTPVITSNVTAMPEIAGEAALLVNPHEVDEMTRMMLKVLSSAAVKNELSKKGIERAKNYSWASTARKTLDVYKGMVT